MRVRCAGIAALCLALATGCAVDRALAPYGGSAALYRAYTAFDMRRGVAVSLPEVAVRARAADAVFFGERHDDPVCAQFAAQLLAEAARAPCGVALALEFFETDTQPALRAYLNRESPESEFRVATRQGPGYAVTHRPLVELCRTLGLPVIAANTPRALLRAYSRSGQDYSAWRATLTDEQRSLLPATNDIILGPYYDRFVAQSGLGPPESQPASAPARPSEFDPLYRAFRSQSLWDQSMAESVATARAAAPWRTVFLVVGGFHVAHDGGTVSKFRALRPADRVLTVLYTGVQELPSAPPAADAGAADIIVYGFSRPPKESDED